jgi:nucleosome binding factor SPN SPT16 subunit
LKLASPDLCYPRGARVLGIDFHENGVYDVETRSSDMKLYFVNVKVVFFGVMNAYLIKLISSDRYLMWK